MRVMRAKITRLQNQIEREHGESAEAKVVMEVIEYYAMTTGHTGTKVTAIGANADAVRKAIRMGHTVAELKEAVDGAAKFPFVRNYRRSATGSRKERYDTLATVLRDENQIMKLRELAGVQPDAKTGEASETPIGTAEAWRKLHYPFARVMAALWDLKGEIGAPGPDVRTAQCPVHSGPGLVARRSEDGLMSVECERGCEFGRLLDGLGLVPADLFENAEQDPARSRAGVPRVVPSHLVEAAGVLRARLAGVAGQGRLV